MKTRHFFFALLAFAFMACGCQKETITVISYNIRMGVANDGENSWQYRCPATKAMIEDQSPDIFGVQEAFDFQVAYIEENCPEYSSIGVGREDGVSAGEHMSIFYKTASIELLDWGTYWLSETPDVPSMGWDAACYRTATWAYMQCKESGRKFYYVNTHLDHVGREAQKNGLALIVNSIADMNPEGYPMILTGDFNVRSSDPVLSDLDKVMSSARKTADKTDETASFNGWKQPLETAALGGHLKDGNDAENAIDYIYYSGFSACPEFETITKGYAGVPLISDHYPVKAVLVF
ncbi:MAG: endonuclease/exonuclease/phosphatase family protein [Clostridium sp.]|nr:endonuclease/exonuclease/phosphatase family protein [Bacteroides sp.]MCM1197472.1 endonuclease/exonuclease/phosphatase family protein [Clostridium sp.]